MQNGYSSIRIEQKSCRGRMVCLHACPTQAIRVSAGKAFILKDRCIDCGECVRVCPSRAIIPQTSSSRDFSRFKYTIALPSPVLYSQFGKDVTPAQILSALRQIGFDDSFDVACASESVSIAIQEFLDKGEGVRPVISPFCPAIVRLIQIRYPDLLDNLIPIESPMEIAAREAKRIKTKELGLKESDIGAIYLTPCPAKLVAIKHPPRKNHSFLDGAVAISDIYPKLLQALSRNPETDQSREIRGLGLGWPILGGQESSLKAEDSIAIGGLNDVVRILDDIENGKIKDVQYIECHSCSTGCVGGSLNVENPYIARGRVLRMVARCGAKTCQDRESIRHLYRENYFSLAGKVPASPVQPLDQDVSKAIQKMQRKQQIYDELPKIDCGACGSPTCLSFAEDVVLGNGHSYDCPFTVMKRLDSILQDLTKTLQRQSERVPTIRG